MISHYESSGEFSISSASQQIFFLKKTQLKAYNKIFFKSRTIELKMHFPDPNLALKTPTFTTLETRSTVLQGKDLKQ